METGKPKRGETEMTRWTDSNTEDFTTEELATLNEAQVALEVAHPETDGSNIADMLNNAFVPGIAAADLIAAVSARIA